MNELVGLVLVPVRNSLILMGLTFRTFSMLVSLCLAAFARSVHAALATRSPLNAAGPEVTLNVALTLAPGATESNVFDLSVVPGMTEVHCLPGTEMFSFTLTAVEFVVLVNVTVDSWLEPGANVCSPGGAAVAEAGVRLNACASDLAAAMLARTRRAAASVGDPPRPPPPSQVPCEPLLLSP